MGSIPSCKERVCTPVQVANGGYSPGDADIVNGTTVTVTCDDGYTVSDPPTVTCQFNNNELSWSGPFPTCSSELSSHTYYI